MAALSPREYRQLKKDAREFARRAKAGTTYYVIDTVHGGGQYVGEIRFTKKALVGLMWGSCSPERLYMLAGPVYEDRHHREIRNLRTWQEHNEFEAKFEAEYLGSKGHHERLDQIASGAFRSTW